MKTTEDNKTKIDWLLAETRRNNGLAPVDTERFWVDQEQASKDPFGSDIPQVPIGHGLMSSELVFDELGIEEDFWRYSHDDAWQVELNRAYNDKAELIIGRRVLSEEPLDITWELPNIKMLHDIFEAENVWSHSSWWLKQSAHTEDELTALLDRVDARLDDLRSFILPENWEADKARRQAMGAPPLRYRYQRGPVTFATSIYGVENLILLIIDRPELAARFRDAVLRAMLGLADVLDKEAGDDAGSAPHGFGFADDNCYLLNQEMYKFFGYPILQAIFERFSPNPEDTRWQHSDSAMGHLLPLLGKLNLTGTNFGPTVSVAEIREHLPKAVIHGQLAPFTYCRNEEENIVAEFLRDFDQAREKRGLLFTTAGSANNGSRLTSLRLIMSAVQHFGRYDA